MDSNHDKQIQNLQCYRYTTRQYKEGRPILIFQGVLAKPFSIFDKYRSGSDFENDAVARATVFKAVKCCVDIRECKFLDERGDLMACAEVEHTGGGGRTAER